MMELLARQWQEPGLADRAFMTGIMSLMDTLLSTPMEEILAPLPVAEDVRAALLANEGRLGALLCVVAATEHPDPAALCSALARLPELSLADVEQAQIGALTWSNGMAA